MAKRIRKHPMSQICRNRPKMEPARTAGRTRKPIFIPRLTARENVELVAEIATDPMRSEDALAMVGLKDRLDHFPAELPGASNNSGSRSPGRSSNDPTRRCVTSH